MALSVSSVHATNNHVPKPESWSNFACSKCICCPYGYHIDLDFVRYCEAVSAESVGSQISIERRKKKERRRQRQSREFLLGLETPSLFESDQNKEISSDTNLPTNILPVNKPFIYDPCEMEHITKFDLGDVIYDFEDALKHSSKSYNDVGVKNHSLNNNDNSSNTLQASTETEIITTEQFNDSNNDGANSNCNTSTLQNIREQMAESLEKMKELEIQVKSIPILQVQLFVLKEEKRKLLQQLEDYNKKNLICGKLRKSRSHSFLKNQSCKDTANTPITLTRDIGTSSTVMTREVSVSCQQAQTRDMGMITQPSLKSSKSTQSDITLEGFLPLLTKNSLYRDINILHTARNFKDCGSNTEYTENIAPLKQSNILCEEKFLEIDSGPKIKKTAETYTENPKSVFSTKNMSLIGDIKSCTKDSIQAYKNSIKNPKELQCKKNVKNKIVQTLSMHILRTNVSVSAKPQTSDIGTNVLIRSDTKSVAVGPDPSTINTISLDSMNLRTRPFNYCDTQQKRMLSKAINVNVADLIKTTTKSTDTLDLLPTTRDFGTSPLKKKFIDVSVGESLKFNNFSSGGSYCDNCKNIFQNLEKQIRHNKQDDRKNKDFLPDIRKCSHELYSEPDNEKECRKQDTYKKVTSSVAKCKADNKDQYNNILRLERLKSVGDTDKLSSYKKLDNEIENIKDKTDVILDSSELQCQQVKPRQKLKPSKEITAALKVLNDNLKKLNSENISSMIKNANNIIHQQWFKTSSTENASPFEVKNYLDLYQEYSVSLLEYIVNMTDSSGNTALHYAVSHGNFDVVSILLDAKVCNTNRPNTAGYTAFMLAALADVRDFSQISVAKRLFQSSDVNIRAKLHGQTALMLAVSHGRKNMTKLLIDAGAEINVQDEDGSTALMCAAEHGHIDIVRLLLNEPNCDSTIFDLDGSSALKIALEAGHHDIGVLLYAHEHVNRGTSPYTIIKRSRRSSK